MSMNRRNFLKAATAGTAAVGLPLGSAQALQRERKEMPPDAVGMLYDSTLCIGCKACMVACKEANGMPPEHAGQKEILWDTPVDLSGKTLNIIKAYRSGSGENKDAENDGYSFVKRHCMHCVDPGCVSACPVSAMEKDPRTGVVTYDAKKCIGCRYCQIGCPFNIPKFEWELAFPEIRKCQMCHHLQAFGGYPACCEFCPTGASLFGPVESLLQEAERRLKLKAGESYEYPLHRIGSGKSEKTVPAKAAGYNGAIYGKDEVGGTQYLLLAGVPFDKLGLPALPSRSYAATSSGIQHTLYKGMIAPLVVFGGLLFAAYKSTGSE
jgi:Fe-S-cluster-containing dehydrogenase component